MRDHHRSSASPFATARAIFLSPHLDDVALSCGGTVALLADQGCEPIVVTVFAGEVPGDFITDFAKWKHGRWGVGSVEENVLRRQEEDRVAVAALGARARWLGYPDAIYRGDRYLSDASLFGTPRAVEIGLVDLIGDEIRRLPEWADDGTVFVPLGIGEHVDHQIMFAVGRLLAEHGARVFAYEDCPYAIHTPAGLDRRLREVEGEIGPPMPVAIGTTLERRIAAIFAYRSQVPVIFRFTTDVSGAVSDFARKIGGPLGPAERFWPVREKAARANSPGVRDHSRQIA
ncbi:MAG TPA: PIG-L family deacetylase [Thermomicrobiales bacterium]